MDKPLVAVSPTGKFIMNLVDRESRDMWESRARKLLRLAKIEREHFIGVSEEWEAERDRYQDMMKKYKDMEDNWHSTCKKLDKERQLHYTSSFALDDARNMIFDTSRKMNEARRWAIDFKEKYEQGAPMTIAGMNTRIAELKERNDRLEDRLNLNKLAIAARNKRISRLREVLRVVTYKPDLSCGPCLGNLVIAKRALKEDNEQTKT